jgi:hypothetical protein
MVDMVPKLKQKALLLDKLRNIIRATYFVLDIVPWLIQQMGDASHSVLGFC